MKAVKRINFLEHWFTACTVGVLTDLALVLYIIYVSTLDIKCFWSVPIVTVVSFVVLCAVEYIRLVQLESTKSLRTKIILE